MLLFLSLIGSICFWLFTGNYEYFKIYNKLMDFNFGIVLTDVLLTNQGSNSEIGVLSLCLELDWMLFESLICPE